MAGMAPVVSLVGLGTAALGMGIRADPRSISPAVSPGKASIAVTADRRTRWGALGHMPENAVVITVSAADASTSAWM
jgi:hypothetical protein